MLPKRKSKTVPEVAIYEHRNFFTTKDEIRLTRQVSAMAFVG